MKQTEEGLYTTGLRWKLDHPVLPKNRDLVEERLRTTTRRLEKIDKLEEYYQHMQQQIEKGYLGARSYGTNWRECTLCALKPLLFDTVLRNHMNKYCVIGDIARAFLQIAADNKDRDAQRILWCSSLTDRKIV